MHTGSFAERLSPVAVFVGVGAALLTGGSGTAAADRGPDRPPSDSAEQSGPDSAEQSDPGPPAVRAQRPQDSDTGPTPRGRATASRRVGPVGTPLLPESPALPESPLPIVSEPPIPAAVIDVPSTRQLPGPSAATGLDRAGLRPAATEATAPAAVLVPVAQAAAADPFGGFFSSFSALWNNQTPRLSPTQSGQSPAGVVSGRLNAVDPDSPRLTFTVAEAPSDGSAAVGADGSWTYTASPQMAAAGGVDSFRVTVSDAASGFAIHGLAGLLHLVSFGLIGSRGDSSTATVTVTVTAVATGNTLPTGRASVTAVDPVTGRVSGVVTGNDNDGDPLRYTVPSATSKGTASIDAVSGVFIYTPTVAARHAAARVGAPAADRADTFTVTISDGRGGTASVPVTVPVSPANTAPVAAAPVVGTPDSVTGVVTGRVSATDADGDTLAYTAASTTGKGSVAVNSATGSFTYTPTVAARQNAAAPGATDADRSDSFTVSVADGYGGTAARAVTVAVSPSANNPPSGAVVIDTPNAVTGVVTGRVTGADPDGDPLTYSGSGATAKGAVSLSPTGVFTYTPTVSARHAAARVGAPAADRADTFTATISDGRGGTAAVPVTVPVSPANTAPVAAAPVVGTPDSVTGVVTGRVNATDADGDPLSYTAPPTTGKGSIALNAATGSFTYTPTAAARQNAAAPGATDADRSDSFTVSVADGYGGTAARAVTVAVSPSTAPATPLAAFPGAEGFGAYATGGRGGSVVYVTNLNADGPGSLQWAVDQPGAKYILFKVSGVINTQIHLTNGDVTIAGQTSPGGITVRGFVTDESPYQDQDVRAPGDFAENWILQHIRIRPGAGGPSDDGLRIRYTRNGIVDHVSIGNATDEAVEISYANNVTIQNTIIAETVGGHSFYGGVLMNYSNPAHGFALDNIALHHNVFNRIEGRLPEGSRESAAAANSYMNLELSNNLYWDPNFFVALAPDTGVGGSSPIYWNLNAVNNLFQVRSGFPYGMFDDQILRTSLNRIFLSGNGMNLYPGRSDYQLFYCCNDYPSMTDGEVASIVASQRAQKLPARHSFPSITYTPTGQLRTVLLDTAGAWPRDPMDIRLMQNVADNTIATAPRNTNPAGDALLPAYLGSPPAAPADTDNDGMPDAWETARGLNPNVANTNGRTLSAVGYTDLEVYLHELSVSRTGGSVL